MKIIIVVSLYLLGTIIAMMWFLGDKDSMDDYNKSLNDDPDLASMPEGFLRICAFFALFISCMTWPYSVLVAPILARVTGENKKKENKK